MFLFWIFSFLFAIGFLSIAVLILRFDRDNRVFSPFFIFVLLFVVSYFLIPVYASYFGYSRYGLVYERRSYFEAMIYSALCLFWLIFFYFLFSLKKNESVPVQIKKIKLGKARYLGFVFLVLCAISFFEFLSLIRSYGLNVFLANRIFFTAGMGYYKVILFFPVLWAMVYCLEIYFVRIGRFYWGNYLKGLLVVVLLSIPLVVLGGRSNLFFGAIVYSVSVLIFLLKIKAYSQYRAFIKAVVLMVAGLLVIGGGLGSVRQELMSENADYISKEENNIPFESVVSAFSSYENMNWIFSNRESVKLYYGATYAAVVFLPIPRFMWESKPTGGGPVMRNLIVPNSYDLIQGDKLSSYTTGYVAESYLNFGYWGFLFLGIIFSAFFNFLRNFIRRADTSLSIVVAVYLVFRSYGFVNAEFYGVVIQLFLVLVFYIICKLFMEKYQ